MMSAESPIRSRSLPRAAGGGVPVTVTPQQVTDPTILDSVAGFINDVVPTSYNLAAESKDQIQWVRFEQLDLGDATYTENSDTDAVVIPTLVLILGYTTGIQIWAIPASGEATEILSWRHGLFRVVKFVPNPHKVGNTTSTDIYATKRPLIALCDSSTQFLAVTFHSLKTGETVKPIRFQNQVLNVLTNRHSVVIVFPEKFAVFDAYTLEPRISVTTCYLSPGIQQNPIALGTRWLAYAEKKLNSFNRSGGGNEGEGVQSYTATVLHAAKSFSRGLREFGETVASSLTGSPIIKSGTSPNSPQAGGISDMPQKGIVAIIDIENADIDCEKNYLPPEAVVAHFVAHTEAIVYLSFDPSGLLLLTADKRGHDFHLFRIQPHPLGGALAAVHHLYILHRGDTTAKVQDMCFSPDSRWVTVSTLRGTTHVFPITPYGGNVGVRTHGTPLVVNKMSRFHRSAGLTAEGRSNSPVSHATESPASSSLLPYHNPRFPPYPQSVVLSPIAQIRQPVYVQNLGNYHHQQRGHNVGRQRLSSSEENIALRVVACFSHPRAWLETPLRPNETGGKSQIRAVESLFIISCHGILVQYDLDPRAIATIPKDRIGNDTPIELKVTAKAQWLLQRSTNSRDVPLPMSNDHLKFVAPPMPAVYKKNKPEYSDDGWLSQVEIVTHSGPHRRLWMGPQFTFKTYVVTNGAVVETRALDVRRSKPVNVPISKANAILIESGSASSTEQLFLDTYHKSNHETGGHAGGESQLKEDLADAMLESPGGHCVIVSMKPHVATSIAKVVNPLGTVVTLQSDEEQQPQDLETIEDNEIHENCDEALFRPIVSAKSLLYTDTKRNACNENILTKSIGSNTEVAVKIINNKSGKDRTDNKKITKHISTTKTRDASPKSNKIKSKEKNNGMKSMKIDTSFTESQTIPKIQNKKGNYVKMDLKENIEKPSKKPDESIHIVKEFNAPPLIDAEEFIIDENPIKELNNFISTTENISKPEIITSSTIEIEPEGKVKKIESIVEEIGVQEEKFLPKKSRKPKTKLGVKIPNAHKEKLTEMSCSPPIRPWSSIVASAKPQQVEIKDSILECENIQTESNEETIEIPEDKPVVEKLLDDDDFFPAISDDLIDLAKKELENENILVDSTKEIETKSNDYDVDLLTLSTDDIVEEIPVLEKSLEDLDDEKDGTETLKIDKSSDDEKLDIGSSPSEITTESDDSTKLVGAKVVIDNDDDDNLLTTQVTSMQTSTRATKRKSKKKKK